MSEENVEIVRQAWEAYRRRDNEAALAPKPDGPGTGTRPIDNSRAGLDGVGALPLPRIRRR